MSAVPPQHIVLVGMMGAGKSTVGRLLAQQLNRPVIDLDALIEQREGATIGAIFERVGEQGFRVAEAAALDVALDSSEPTIVAAGGGIVEGPAVLRLRDAICVWLKASPGTIAVRVGSGQGRPLLAGDSAATIERLVAERADKYQAVATITVAVDDTSVDGVVYDVTQALEALC